MRKNIKMVAILLCVSGLFMGCDSSTISEEDKDTIVQALDDITKAFDNAKEASDNVDSLEEEFDKKWDTITDSIEDTEESKPEVMTVENTPMLKEILTSFDPDNEEHLQFIKDHSYEVIEFDGAIDIAEMLPNKKTRMSMLLRHGDYDPNIISGPALKVKDVGINGKALEGIGGSLGAITGKNVHVVAKIHCYNSNADYIEIGIETLTTR